MTNKNTKNDDARGYTLRVRLSKAERMEIEKAAGKDTSTWVRKTVLMMARGELTEVGSVAAQLKQGLTEALETARGGSGDGEDCGATEAFPEKGEFPVQEKVAKLERAAVKCPDMINAKKVAGAMGLAPEDPTKVVAMCYPFSTETCKDKSCTCRDEKADAEAAMNGVKKRGRKPKSQADAEKPQEGVVRTAGRGDALAKAHRLVLSGGQGGGQDGPARHDIGASLDLPAKSSPSREPLEPMGLQTILGRVVMKAPVARMPEIRAKSLTDLVGKLPTSVNLDTGEVKA